MLHFWFHEVRDWRAGARQVGALGIAVLLGACSTTISHLAPLPVEASKPGWSPPPNEPAYHVQVGDILEVKFLLNPELNEEVTVRPDGKISTTVAEEVGAYNQTIEQIAAQLRQAYRAELINPRLNVILKWSTPSRVYVAGEVSTPGEFTTAGPNLTLSQAVARAGGLRPSGDPDRVFVIRRGGNDLPQSYATRFREVISGRDATADVRLAPYDVVYVPRTDVAEVFQYWNQYVQQFVPVSWGFSYVLPPNSNTAVVPTTR